MIGRVETLKEKRYAQCSVLSAQWQSWVVAIVRSRAVKELRREWEWVMQVCSDVANAQDCTYRCAGGSTVPSGVRTREW